MWFLTNHMLSVTSMKQRWGAFHWKDAFLKLKQSGSYSFTNASADTGHKNTRIKFFFRKRIFKINVELSDCSYLWNASSQWFSVCWKFLTSNKKNISFDARFYYISEPYIPPKGSYLYEKFQRWIIKSIISWCPFWFFINSRLAWGTLPSSPVLCPCQPMMLHCFSRFETLECITPLT